MKKTIRPVYGLVGRFSISQGQWSLRMILAAPTPLGQVSLWLNGELSEPEVNLNIIPPLNWLHDDIKLLHYYNFELSKPIPPGLAEIPEYELELNIQRADGSGQLCYKTSLRDLECFPTAYPVPDEAMQIRIGQPPNGSFSSYGWLLFCELRNTLEQYRSLASLERILDWGCGCGRIARYFMEVIGPERVFGCDIDPLTIDWMSRNMGWTFSQNRPAPPLFYPDNSFDLVYGTSVITHLTEGGQFGWLAELNRILRPGGLGLISVHGPYMLPTEQRRALEAAGGFWEPGQDNQGATGKFISADQYRPIYHTPDYIATHWSDYIEVVEYIEVGLCLAHSLVVVRKRI